MIELELRRLRHDPLEIITRAIQPILWVSVFGVVMARVRAFPSVGDYVTFITPGVIMQSSTFIALAYGISLVFERDLGILKKLLTSPIPRSSVVIGRAFAGGIRASTQYIIVLLSAMVVGAKVVSNPINLFLGYIFLVYGCIGFTSLSMIIAITMKSRERFMGVIGAVTMPLFFASNALYPIDMMPEIIKHLAMANPLTYIVDMLRKLLVYNSYEILNDIAAVSMFVAGATVIAVKILNRIVE
ncbi:MAG: ABC transporter permease [Ignisphaera sp.]|nr:ABC transporter permease [Ignisphaera sp.]MCX8167766.1 ABC transporter permease [Ignisphaera sp.]